MNPNYIDFSLGFEVEAGGGYRVRALAGNAEAESVTNLPFDADTLSGLLISLESAVSHPQKRSELPQAGQVLFEALLPGEVGELYASEWNAAIRNGQGLRIRLHLRPRNRDLAWLCRIPWELIFDERAGGFPCLNPLNPLVRHLSLPRPVEAGAFGSSIRVLVAAANPSNLPTLDLEEEQERIGAARGHKKVDVNILERASPEELRRELASGRYQVVHFMGHGIVDADGGSLVFSTPDGRGRAVTGNEMLHLLQGISVPPLVILNACRTAASSPTGGAEPLAGVAAALVRGGAPAVVGMQIPISDSAALTFSQTLYERLAESDAIEAAVAEARLAVYMADPYSADWIAPVLFIRGAASELSRQIDEDEGGTLVKEKPSHTVLIKGEVIRAVGNIDLVAGDYEPGARIDHSVELTAEAKSIEAGGNFTVVGVRKTQP